MTRNNGTPMAIVDPVEDLARNVREGFKQPRRTMSDNSSPQHQSPLHGFNLREAKPTAVPAALQSTKKDPERIAIALRDPLTAQILVIRCVRLSDVIIASVAFANRDGTFDQMRLSSREILLLAQALERSVATSALYELPYEKAMIEALHHAALQKAELEGSYLSSSR